MSPKLLDVQPRDIQIPFPVFDKWLWNKNIEFYFSSPFKGAEKKIPKHDHDPMLGLRVMDTFDKRSPRPFRGQYTGKKRIELSELFFSSFPWSIWTLGKIILGFPRKKKWYWETRLDWSRFQSQGGITHKTVFGFVFFCFFWKVKIWASVGTRGGKANRDGMGIKD